MNSKTQLKKPKKRIYTLINNNYKLKKITSLTQKKENTTEKKIINQKTTFF